MPKPYAYPGWSQPVGRAASGRRRYVSRGQRIEAKRARRANRAKFGTIAQAAAKTAYQARQLERGLVNMRGGPEDEPTQQTT